MMRLWPWWRRGQRPVILVDPEDAQFTRVAGRRHLSALPYPMPKDFEEVGRLDFQHFLLRAGFQSNYAAPITNPAVILDVGTGSARWAMELASLFPAAQVFGLDLVPPAVDDQQLLGRGLDHRPPNYQFHVGNVLEGLPFPEGSIDFVHMRSLASALPQASWPMVVGELARVTRQGGWVELAEFGVPQAGGPGLSGLWQSWVDLSATRGVNLQIGASISAMVRAAGLVHVGQRAIAFPMGVWGGRIGVATATDFLAIGRALRGPMLASGTRDENTYDRLLKQAQQEFQNAHGPQGYQPYYLAYGQKP